MNHDTIIIVTAAIKGIDGNVRNVELQTTWGEWQGNANSYAAKAARHRRMIGQVKGERAVQPIRWTQA